MWLTTQRCMAQGRTGEAALGSELLVMEKARPGLPTWLSCACGGLSVTRYEGRRGKARYAMHAGGAGAKSNGCGEKLLERRRWKVSGAAQCGSGRSVACRKAVCEAVDGIALRVEGVWRAHLVTSFGSAA